jgi:tetratricopeptide (TPR) repeat protein
MCQVTHIRVFISYSWDDDLHKARVLDLAQRLRHDGIDAWVDQFTPFAPRGWDAWMQDEVARASFVLCVITKSYADRFLGRTPPGVGRGVKWEGSIISDAIYRADSSNTKFIPIFFDQKDSDHTPFPLSVHVNLNYVLPDGYDYIYRLLTDQPSAIPVPIGPMLVLPPATPSNPLSQSPASPLSQPKVYRHRSDRGNLPRLPYFFGREEQLQTIDAALQPAERTWLVLIDGPGGIGKTALAIRAAELSSEDDYPRIVFASAKVRELEPDGVHAVHDFLIDSYLDLLNSIARELGDDALAKLDEKERPDALRRLLHDKPALLVLDNLESLPREDLERLLKFLNHLPQGTKAIITSRRRTDIQAKTIRLDWMGWDAAAELLDELAGRYPRLKEVSREERLRLYQNTGGNPLIIRWVAGQLGRGRGRCRTVGDALSLLRESPAGDEALEFIFGDLVETFTAEEMKLLAALTYFTQPAEVKHIAELAGLGELITQDALENLVDRALVVGDEELSRFSLTPLVADFLRRKKPEAVRSSGDHLAEAVYALATENGYYRYNRFPILEEAWPMLEAGLPILDYDKLQTVCDALGVFLGSTCRWDESIALNRLAEDTAAAQGKFWKAGWRACHLAGVFFHRRNAEEVKAAADRATQHWQKVTPSNYELGKLSRRRGMAYELLEDYPAALNAYRETLDLWRKISLGSKEVAIALNSIAGIKRLTKNYEGARRDYQEALRIAKHTGSDEGEATYTGNLAALTLDLGQWREAEELARQALKLARKVRDRELLAVNYRRIAEALFGQARLADGMPYASRAVELLTALRSPELAGAEKTLQKFKDAVQDLDIESMKPNWSEEEQESLADLECGDRLIEGRALYDLGLMLQDQGRHKDAEVRFREALAIWPDGARTIEGARIRNSLGWSLQKQKRWEDAERSYREALDVCREINDSEERRRSEENLTRLNEERVCRSATDWGAALDCTQGSPAGSERPFESEIRAYEKEDLSSPTLEGGILFFGGSSIRLWQSLETDFPDYPVLNHGFGGARVRDCVQLYPRLVKPYSPRVVILYAGDNDLADGSSPQHILHSLEEFLDLLSQDSKTARVAFISIKPSPARRCLDDIEETNRLIEKLTLRRDDLAFLNVYDKMLKPDGSPNGELFLEDGLHMSPAGYKIWREVVAAYLSAVWPQPVNPI